MTNELFFHVVADLGHGIKWSEPLTRYRVHEASMTDRRTPGVFAAYMAGVCDDVAGRLEGLVTAPPSSWATVRQLVHLADSYRSRAINHRQEAAHQRERAIAARPRRGRDTSGNAPVIFS